MENNDTEKFVNAVVDKNNVKAFKFLEKVLKEKVAKKIADTLNNG